MSPKGVSVAYISQEFARSLKSSPHASYSLKHLTVLLKKIYPYRLHITCINQFIKSKLAKTIFFFPCLNPARRHLNETYLKL